MTFCRVVERRKHERHEETAARRRDWSERYTQRRSARGTQPSSSNNDLNQYISTAEHSEYGSHHQLSSTLHARPTGAGGGYQASVNSDATRAPNVQVLGAAAAGGRNTAVTSGQEQKQGFRKWFSRGKAAAGKKKDDDATTAMDDVRGTATTQSTSGGAPSVYSVTDGIICYYFLFCFVWILSLILFMALRVYVYFCLCKLSFVPLSNWSRREIQYCLATTFITTFHSAQE